MSDVLTLGTTEPQEQPQSGAENSAKQGTTRTVVLRGDETQLRAEKPAVGSTWYDGGEAHAVLSAELRPEKGGLATLTIQLAPGDPESGEPDPLETKWEVNWQQIEKPLLSHPDVSDPDAIAKWKELPDRADKVDTLSEPSRKWARKILKGVESYLIFAPVAKRTDIYPPIMPTTGRCGLRGDPAGAPSIPDGYEWLKTADGAVQQDDGRYVRTQEWTGSDEWDADLYEAAP